MTKPTSEATTSTRNTSRKQGSTAKKRDAGATQTRILKAAKKEFAKNGLGGARIDKIAERAKANKRMIYHYFGSKEELFQRTMEEAYLDIRNAEQRLDLENQEPTKALRTLVTFTWDYYLKNPEFITLVNSENLHKARHLQKSEIVHQASRRFVDMVSTILRRGTEAGVFRDGIDPVQLNITIAAIGYYYLNNRYTGSIIFEQDLMTEQALKKRLEFNLETIMRLVCV